MDKRYIVTKGSECDSLQKGDHIRIYKDGTIGCVEAQGWLNKEDSEKLLKEIEIEVDVMYYENQWEQATSKLKGS